jgi:creatinine amidohydrolase
LWAEESDHRLFDNSEERRMKHRANYRKVVQVELMLGSEATEALQAFPVGYLPIGGLERHGDHLPMGLDVIKAHRICCLAARVIGGVVFPAHFYSAIHRLQPDVHRRVTSQWADLFTDATAKANLQEIISQLQLMGLKVLVLYSGHYPVSQVEMIREIAAEVAGRGGLTVIPFAECMLWKGDHAGVSETSLMLYLDKSLVDMTRISDVNYRNHGWSGENDPLNASSARGESETDRVIDHLQAEISRALEQQETPGAS